MDERQLTYIKEFCLKRGKKTYFKKLEKRKIYTFKKYILVITVCKYTCGTAQTTQINNNGTDLKEYRLEVYT